MDVHMARTKNPLRLTARWRRSFERSFRLRRSQIHNCRSSKQNLGCDEHLSLAKHFAAEHKLPPEFKAGHGMIVRWENTRRRKNHWLDASVLALLAGDYLGARLIGGGEVSPQKPRVVKDYFKQQRARRHRQVPA